MPSNESVVWSEGMFMRPQHMQQHTRYVEGLVHSVLDASLPFGWGFAHLSLDRTLLASGSLGIKEARGLFPDATPFNLISGGGAPSIQLSNAEPGAIVCLCTAQRGGGARAQEYARGGDGQGARYESHTIDVVDNAAVLSEGDGSSAANRRPSAAPIVVGQLQVRLLVDSQDEGELLRLPVARVADVLSDGSVRLDEDFIAPVTRLSASPVLAQYVREISTMIGSRAEALARRVGDMVAETEFSLDILWLLISNRYDSILKNIAATDIHPAQLYSLLLGIAGELSTLNSPNRRPGEFPPYDHVDPASCFGDIVAELRSLWSAEPPKPVKPLQLVYADTRQTWLSKIADHSLLDNADFVLAAKADISEEELAKHLPEQMIIAPAEQIDEHVTSLRLSLAKIKPPGVPALRQWAYFYIEAEGPTWEGLKSSAAFAFFVDRLAQDFPGLKLKLWAVPRGN
jgi:type VI secretion system protein ImpJ